MKKRSFFDRADAKRVEMPGMMQLAVDLKPNRSVSDVYINEKVPANDGGIALGQAYILSFAKGKIEK